MQHDRLRYVSMTSELSRALSDSGFWHSDMVRRILKISGFIPQQFGRGSRVRSQPNRDQFNAQILGFPLAIAWTNKNGNWGGGGEGLTYMARGPGSTPAMNGIQRKVPQMSASVGATAVSSRYNLLLWRTTHSYGNSQPFITCITSSENQLQISSGEDPAPTCEC